MLSCVRIIQEVVLFCLEFHVRYGHDIQTRFTCLFMLSCVREFKRTINRNYTNKYRSYICSTTPSTRKNCDFSSILPTKKIKNKIEMSNEDYMIDHYNKRVLSFVSYCLIMTHFIIKHERRKSLYFSSTVLNW